MSQESDQLPKEGQELQQENPSSTTNEGENVDGVGLQESTNSGMNTEKEGQELQQENTSSTKNEGENVDGVGLQESTNSGMNTEKMLEMFTNAIASENDRQSHNMLEMFTNAIASENDRQSHNMTTLLATALKNLAITIQNSKVSKMVTPEPDELNQNYSENWLNRISAKEARKAYYDTRGRRGLLCILLLEKDWVKANKEDEDVLRKFFEEMLGFVVETYTSYDVLNDEIRRKNDLTADNYYCLLICISGHGYENGVITKCQTLTTREGMKEYKILQSRSTENIKHRFSNEIITTLAGVPKIIILDTCRGPRDNITVAVQSQDTKKRPFPDNLPATDSDCIIIHATTHGRTANIPDEGSVGIQGVMEIFKKNWETDHLEEMLIDARMNVSTWSGKNDDRQILEIQTTLLKRLKFEKFVVCDTIKK